MLIRESQLTKLVKRVGEKDYTYEEYLALPKSERTKKINLSEAKFFLREDEMERTEKILNAHSPTVLNTVLLCVFILAIFVCLSLVMPSLLNLLDNYIAQNK